MDTVNEEIKLPKRILNTLLASLSAGVVPRSGAPYIAIGRREEIASLLDSMETVGEGGAAVRFLIGRYGSGKSFLIQRARGYALDRDFLTAEADLSPDRRLSGGAADLPRPAHRRHLQPGQGTGLLPSGRPGGRCA